MSNYDNEENDYKNIDSGKPHYKNCYNCARGKCRKCIICKMRLYEGYRSGSYRRDIDSLSTLKCCDEARWAYSQNPWGNGICYECTNKCKYFEKCNNYVCGRCRYCSDCESKLVRKNSEEENEEENEENSE
jgi:hypothetical protein